MPLIKSSSKRARNKNIKTEIAAGKPLNQAIAIGYSVQRKAKGKKTALLKRATKAYKRTSKKRK